MKLLVKDELQDIDPSVLIQSVLTHFLEKKSERRTRESDWERYYNAYFMRKSIFPQQEHPASWQSDFISPKFFYLIEQFVAIIRKSLLQSREFFKISAQEPFEELGLKLQKALSYYLSAYNFIKEFEKAIRWGAITSEVIMKVDWKQEFVETRMGQVKIKQYPEFKAISPFDFVSDEFGRWAIHRYYMSKKEVEYLQKVGAFNEFNIEKSTTLEPEKASGSAIPTRPLVAEGMVEVKEFWGDLLLKDELIPSIHCIIVNDKHLALIEHFEYYHRSLPFVKTVMFSGFELQDGVGLMDIIFPLIYSLSFITRTIEDSIVASSINVFELDKTLVDPDFLNQLKEKKLSPFSIILKGGKEDVLKAVQLANFNPNTLPLIQLYNQEIQNASGITEFLMGLPTSKGRPTATEVRIKLQQNIATMDSITSKIESEILTQVIYKLAHLIVQFESPEKLALFGLNFVSEEQRKEVADLIDEKILISVSGISEVMHRAEKIEKLMTFLEFANQLPNLNLEFFVKKLAILLDLDPEKVISQTPPEIAEAQKEKVKLFVKLLLQLDTNTRNQILELSNKIPLELLAEAIYESVSNNRNMGGENET